VPVHRILARFVTMSAALSATGRRQMHTKDFYSCMPRGPCPGHSLRRHVAAQVNRPGPNHDFLCRTMPSCRPGPPRPPVPRAGRRRRGCRTGPRWGWPDVTRAGGRRTETVQPTVTPCRARAVRRWRAWREQQNLLAPSRWRGVTFGLAHTHLAHAPPKPAILTRRSWPARHPGPGLSDVAQTLRPGTWPPGGGNQVSAS
jgi:hypothetical protein